MAARKTKPEGRPKGALGKRTLTLRARLDGLIPDDQLIKLMWKLALEGDGRVATYLADRKWGKMPTPVIGEDDGPPVQVRVVADNRLGTKP